jgi:hypothetical protein
MLACFDRQAQSLDPRSPAQRCTRLPDPFPLLLLLLAQAFLVDHDDGEVEFVGNRTECALLVLGRKWGGDYKAEREEKRLAIKGEPGVPPEGGSRCSPEGGKRERASPLGSGKPRRKAPLGPGADYSALTEWRPLRWPAPPPVRAAPVGRRGRFSKKDRQGTLPRTVSAQATAPDRLAPCPPSLCPAHQRCTDSPQSARWRASWS